MVYDITREKTFANISKWIEDLKNGSDEDLIIMLVGNKVDLCQRDQNARKVSSEEGEKISKENGLLFFETSAIEGVNVTQVFEKLLNGIIQKKNNLILYKKMIKKMN